MARRQTTYSHTQMTQTTWPLIGQRAATLGHTMALITCRTCRCAFCAWKQAISNTSHIAHPTCAPRPLAPHISRNPLSTPSAATIANALACAAGAHFMRKCAGTTQVILGICTARARDICAHWGCKKEWGMRRSQVAAYVEALIRSHHSAMEDHAWPARCPGRGESGSTETVSLGLTSTGVPLVADPNRLAPVFVLVVVV